MNKKLKGNFGYINNYKLKNAIIGFLSIAMVFVIYLTGYFIYGSNKSLFSILAAVSALPAAKFFIAYILVLPYKSGSLDLFNKLTTYGKCGEWNNLPEEEPYTPDNYSITNNGVTIISDLILTTYEKIINIDFIVINRGHVYAYGTHPKLDKEFANNYIKKILDNTCNYKAFKFYSSESEFVKAVEESYNIHTENDFKTMVNDLKIATKIIPYSV